MTPKDASVEYTIKTLENAIAHHQQRLKNGEKLRERVGEAINRGEYPDHYRVRWIQDSVQRVNDTLIQVAEEFNRAHPEDRCSAQDLGDVLASTLAALYQAAKRG